MGEPSKWAMGRVDALRDALAEYPGDPIGWKREAIARALDAARRDALEEAFAAQPATAVQPGTEYERGYFDGVMAYAAALRTLNDREDSNG